MVVVVAALRQEQAAMVLGALGEREGCQDPHQELLILAAVAAVGGIAFLIRRGAVVMAAQVLLSLRIKVLFKEEVVGLYRGMGVLLVRRFIRSSQAVHSRHKGEFKMSTYALCCPTAEGSTLYNVVSVIAAEEAFVNVNPPPIGWLYIRCSYNTSAGVHYLANPITGPDGATTDPTKPALRANYPGIGYIYDLTNDVFYSNPPAGYAVNAPTWVPTPIAPYPDDGQSYVYDAINQIWVIAQPDPTPTIPSGSTMVSRGAIAGGGSIAEEDSGITADKNNPQAAIDAVNAFAAAREAALAQNAIATLAANTALASYNAAVEANSPTAAAINAAQMAYNNAMATGDPSAATLLSEYNTAVAGNSAAAENIATLLTAYNAALAAVVVME